MRVVIEEGFSMESGFAYFLSTAKRLEKQVPKEYRAAARFKVVPQESSQEVAEGYSQYYIAFVTYDTKEDGSAHFDDTKGQDHELILCMIQRLVESDILLKG